MKKNIFGFMAIAAVAALSLASCNKSQPQVEAKSESKAPAELKIAYVEVDSIMTQYTFAKEYSALLEKKGQSTTMLSTTVLLTIWLPTTRTKSTASSCLRVAITFFMPTRLTISLTR